MEISFETWEGVQRHGQDLADRLAQGFTGLLHAPPQFPWPPASHKRMPFEIDLPVVPFGAARGAGKDFFPTAAVASVIDIGGRLGQAGAEIGASVGGAVQHAVRQLPVPFRNGQIRRRKLPPPQAPSPAAAAGEGAVGLAVERAVDRCPLEAAAAAAAAATGSAAASTVSGVAGGDDLDEEDEGFGCEIGTFGNFKKAKGTVNISATYNTRNNDVESSVVARGDLWRVEASHGSSTSANDSSPLYLIQLGPLLFVRDSTLLLPVHLSKQHLLWYGYDRKNGVHSLCPAIWSKHRRWLMMSMMCLNPVACVNMRYNFIVFSAYYSYSHMLLLVRLSLLVNHQYAY